MTLKLITYTTKPEATAENEARIRDVFTGFNEATLHGLSYKVFKTGAHAFAHLVSFATDEVQAAFQVLPAFKAFGAGISARVEAVPLSADLKIIGQYGSED